MGEWMGGWVGEFLTTGWVVKEWTGRCENGFLMGEWLLKNGWVVDG